MSLPLPWIDRIFEKLTLTYGQAFLAKWRDIDIGRVKTDWGHELAGFENWPEAIAHGLQNLPPDQPPTVLQFRALCHKAPAREVPQIPAPAVDHERMRAELARLKKVFNPAPRNVVETKDWARTILRRFDSGEKVNPAALRMARTALGVA